MFERKRPIYSALEEEPDLQDEISDFVIGLAQFVDSLQDAEATADLEQLDRLAGELAEQAARFGYPPLAALARDVGAACRQGKREAAEETLLDLTKVAQRVRRGHRGAA